MAFLYPLPFQPRLAFLPFPPPPPPSLLSLTASAISFSTILFYFLRHPLPPFDAFALPRTLFRSSPRLLSLSLRRKAYISCCRMPWNDDVEEGSRNEGEPTYLPTYLPTYRTSASLLLLLLELAGIVLSFGISNNFFSSSFFCSLPPLRPYPLGPPPRSLPTFPILGSHTDVADVFFLLPCLPYPLPLRVSTSQYRQ